MRQVERQWWSTPVELVRQIEAALGVQVEVDACATLETAKAPVWYGPDSLFSYDGLDDEARWSEDGVTWVNPPYGDIRPWVQKALRLVESAPKARVLLLVPPRTDQIWWHELASSKWAKMMAIRPRISFVAPSGIKASSPSFPVVLWEVARVPVVQPCFAYERPGRAVQAGA